MTAPLWQKANKIKEPLDEGERRKWKAGLKLNIQEIKIMVSGPITSWQIGGETMETVFSFLYDPTLTSIHDYWKNHSFDSTDLCRESNDSAFQYAVEVGHNFSSKEQATFNFLAAVTICSDFGAPQNKVCHCFHCFPVSLP